MGITCVMKLRKSSYSYAHSSFSCYHGQRYNNYLYNIRRPYDRIKAIGLHPVDKDICYVMHIYDTLQLTVYNGWTLYKWMLHAL